MSNPATCRSRLFAGLGAAFLSTAWLVAMPVWGHHSNAGLDDDTIVAFEGTVTEFAFRNPHVYVSVDTTDASGKRQEWSLQMGGANGLTRRGWARDTLRVGDQVAVRVHPATDGRPYALVESIDKEGGLALTPVSDVLAVPASATTLAGRWRADGSKLISYPGGFDGFFHAQLKLTEQGAAAQARYDPLSAENPESTCIGRPTPAALVSSRGYLLEYRLNEDEDTIVIRSEYFDEERTIYMDGRPHPDGNERFATGHSIGRWEGATLVIDTTNFTDHRSPYQIGVPSGPQKHVVERYRLIENSTRMAAEFMLEDPEYIAEPLTHQRELIYSPHDEMYRHNCDSEAASRFLR